MGRPAGNLPSPAKAVDGKAAGSQTAALKAVQESPQLQAWGVPAPFLDHDSMKAEISGWTIVLIGAWNQAIFTPDWIATHLLGEKGDVTVDLGLAFGSDERSYDYTGKGVGFRLSSGRLTVLPLTLDDGAIRLANECVVRVLKTLKHTPISAVGFNYLFTTDTPSAGVRKAIETADAEYLVDCGLTIDGTKVTQYLRGVTEHGGPRLNLTFRRENETAVYAADFNYHYRRDASGEFLTWIGSAFDGLRTHAMRVLRAYGETITEEENHDD